MKEFRPLRLLLAAILTIGIAFVSVPAAVAEESPDPAPSESVAAPSPEESEAPPAKEQQPKPAESEKAESAAPVDADEPTASKEPKASKEPEASKEPKATDSETAEPSLTESGAEDPQGVSESVPTICGLPTVSGSCGGQGGVGLTKSNGQVVGNSDGSWTVTFEITLTNTSWWPRQVVLKDLAPKLPAGWDLAGNGWTVRSTGRSPISRNPADPSVIWAGAMPGGANYRYVVSATLVPTSEATSIENCGLVNTATATVEGIGALKATTVTDKGCASVRLPKLTITKAAGDATQNPDGSWTVTYRIQVKNESDMNAPAEVTDSWPDLPSGWTLAGGVWTVQAVGRGTPITNRTSEDSPIWSGRLRAGTAYEYLVSGTLVPSGAEASQIGECEAGQGLVNRATLVSAKREFSDAACVSIVEPALEVDKSDPQVRQLADLSWQAEYRITVTNPSKTTSTHYTLTDLPSLGAGFTGDGEWVGEAPGEDTLIRPGEQHDYTYRVSADYTPVDNPGLTCAEGGGLGNTATVMSPGGTVSDASCGEVGQPTVAKQAMEPVFDADTGQWTLGFEVAVSNPSEIDLAYTLDDNSTELPAGVTEVSWTASDPVATGGGAAELNAEWSGTGRLATGTLPAGAVHTYTVTGVVTVDASAAAADLGCDAGGVRNTAVVSNGVGGDESSDCAGIAFDDVGLVKTHSDIPTEGVVKPGDQFDYVLTVTNHGSRDATEVEVTDTIPDRLRVDGLTLPQGWSNLNDPALVDDAGMVAVGVPTLAVGESADIVVHVTVLPLADDATPTDGETSVLTNTACVAAAVDSNPDNNCGEDVLDLENPVKVLAEEDEDSDSSDDSDEKLAHTGASGLTGLIAAGLAAVAAGSFLLWRRRNGGMTG